MFRIIENLAPFRFQKGDRIANHGEIFRLIHVQDFGDMQIPGLPHNRDHRCLRISQGAHADIISGRTSSTTSHSKSNDLGMLKRQLARSQEILGVFWIRKRIAPFDVIHTDLIQLGGNQQFILQREIDPFTLAAIPECRIVDLDSRHEFAFRVGFNKKSPQVQPEDLCFVRDVTPQGCLPVSNNRNCHLPHVNRDGFEGSKIRGQQQHGNQKP